MKFTTVVVSLTATFAQASSSFTTNDATTDTTAVVSEHQLQRMLLLDNISNNVHPDPVKRALKPKYAKNRRSKSKSNVPVVSDDVPDVVPEVPDLHTIRKFEGTYAYPGCGGGFFRVNIDCDFDNDLCVYEEFKVGTFYDTDLVGEDVRDDSFISVGDPDSPNLFIKPSTVEDRELICTFSGTFSASTAGKERTNELKPIALSVSDACNDAAKAKQYVVKVASLFDRVYLSFSQDGGETYYTQDQPRSTRKVETEGEERRNLSLLSFTVSALRGAASAISTAIKVVDSICEVFIPTDPCMDPNDPRDQNCAPINYTNPFNPADIPEGWVGGLAQSNTNFAYPTVDLSSIDVTTNMANIDKLTRMQKFKWPEFSWEMVPGQEDTRVFKTFEENISRLGYDNEGKVWSIICPQDGFKSYIGDLNVEVSVTGVRGWHDEIARSTGVDMSVKGVFWISANNSEEAHPIFRVLLDLISDLTDLPFSKSTAIQVLTNMPGTGESLFALRDGADPDYNAPHFKTHWNEGAYAQVYLQAQVGRIVVRDGQTQVVTDFNELFIAIFNLAAGNMFKFENVLSWNIWGVSPEIVNQTEWQNHAEHWRESYNDNHQTEDEGSELLYYDGAIASPFTNGLFLLDQVDLILTFIEDHFDSAQVDSTVNRMIMDESFSESDEEEVKDTLRRHRLL